jgi:single-strand DNA-binding protein
LYPPEIKYFSSSSVLGQLRIKVPTYDEKAHPIIIDTECWGRTAEVCAKYLNRGSRVLVEGKLQKNTWKGADGSNREKYIIVASSIQFLDVDFSCRDNDD